MAERKWNGMNWIRQEKRLAIYLRDGLACVYCGNTLEDSKLTLDHIIPVSKGGSNAAWNLLTCCHTCNSGRGNRHIRVWLEAVANYRGDVTYIDLAKKIRNHTRRVLPMKLAIKVLAQRNGGK